MIRRSECWAPYSCPRDSLMVAPDRLFDPDPPSTPHEAREWIAKCREALWKEPDEVLPRVRPDAHALPRLRCVVAPEGTS